MLEKEVINLLIKLSNLLKTHKIYLIETTHFKIFIRHKINFVICIKENNEFIEFSQYRDPEVFFNNILKNEPFLKSLFRSVEINSDIIGELEQFYENIINTFPLKSIKKTK